MSTTENDVQRLVRLGIALANDLVDDKGDTWIHLAEQMFDEDMEHSLMIGVCAMFLKMDFDEEDIVVILKVATSVSFQVVYGNPLVQDWKTEIN